MKQTVLRITLLVSVLLLGLCLAGCGGGTDSGSGGAPGDNGELGAPAGAIGYWRCEATASDGETDTSFYALRVEESGEFSLYDYAAGNPGISGTMSNVTDTTVDVRFDPDDFDPPFCWELSENGDTLSYEVDGDTLKLGHDDVWLTFHPSEE